MRTLLITVVLGGSVLLGAGACPGRTKAKSCEITGRDDTTITMRCLYPDGNKIELERVPGDLYPGCQVKLYWPGCKER